MLDDVCRNQTSTRTRIPLFRYRLQVSNYTNKKSNSLYLFINLLVY